MGSVKVWELLRMALGVQTILTLCGIVADFVVCYKYKTRFPLCAVLLFFAVYLRAQSREDRMMFRIRRGWV